MKNFTKQFTNKTLFKPTRWLLMALMLLLGTGSAWAKTIYLLPNNDWKSSNAWFAVWAWGAGDKFYKADKDGDYYKVTVPDGTTGVQWFRMISSSTHSTGYPPSGDNGYWNKTGDVTLSNGDLVTITGWDSYQQTTYTTPTTYTGTIKFKRPSAWKNIPKIHMYTDCGEVENGGCDNSGPCNMTLLGTTADGSSWYEYSYSYTTTCTKFTVMFNNGGWSNGETGKTVNDYDLGKSYCLTSAGSGQSVTKIDCPSCFFNGIRLIGDESQLNLGDVNKGDTKEVELQFEYCGITDIVLQFLEVGTGFVNKPATYQDGIITYNISFTPTEAGEKTAKIYIAYAGGGTYEKIITANGVVACEPTATLASASYNATTKKIDLSGSMDPCGKDLYYGFLWRKQGDNWVADNAHAISGTGNSFNNSSKPEEFSQSWGGFTAGTTYEFTAYALEAKSSEWYYNPEGIEVSTCIDVQTPSVRASATEVCQGGEVTLTLTNQQDDVTYTVNGTEAFTDANEFTATNLQSDITYTIAASSTTACTNDPKQAEVNITVLKPSFDKAYIGFVVPAGSKADQYTACGDVVLQTWIQGATQYTIYENDEDIETGDATGKTTSYTPITYTITGKSAGNYVYKVVYKDACDNTFTTGTITLTVPATIDAPEYTLVEPTVCGDSENNGSLTIVNKVDGISYTINDVATDNLTLTAADHTAEKTYTITATRDDAPTCTASITESVKTDNKNDKVNSILIEATPATTVCPGNDVTLQLDGEAQEGVTFQWYKDEEPLVNEIEATLTLTNVQAADAGSYKLKAFIIENDCEGVKWSNEIEISLASADKPNALSLSGVLNIQNCNDVAFDVDNFAGASSYTILAVLYEGGIDEVDPAEMINGTEYNDNGKIGDGKVVAKGTANRIVIQDLDPYKDYTIVVYQYSNNCIIYSDPCKIERKRNVPIFSPIAVEKINETSVKLTTTATHIATAQSGPAIREVKFYYKTTSGNWSDSMLASLSGSQATVTINGLTRGESYYFKAEGANNSCQDAYSSVETTEPTLIECPVVEKPTLENVSYCGQQNSINLPAVTGSWYTSENGNQTVTSPVQVTETVTYYATNKASGTVCESDRTPYTITINPVPSITEITGAKTAVYYQDVTLTATATQGATVKWYEGGVEKATGATYVVTSATEPSKTVTAKAFLNGCESEATTKTVTFGEEVCNNVADMTKIYLDVSENTGFITGNNAYVSVTASGNNSANCDNTSGANQNNYVPKNDTWWGTMTKVAGENYIYEITIPNNVTINKGTTKLSFWNNLISGNSDVWEVQAILGQTISAGTNCMKLSNETKTHNDNRHSHLYCGTWTTYKNAPTISAPAVKTVSVTSDEDGNVTMVGQVVKTGCDTQAILGLQYKKQNPDGTTYEANYTTYPNPGTKEAISAGKTFTVTTKLEDGTYLVRARIDNSHTTNGYGEDIKVVVNTTKTAISNVTLDYCNDKGTSIDDPNPMCKGAIAYVKLHYTGSKYSDIKWLVEGVETNLVKLHLVTDEGDGVWSYEIQGDGNLSVELKNDANTDPAWPYSNKLPFTIIPEPTAPYISIDPASGVICQGSSATIKVENPSTACSYKLVEEELFTPYESGDLTYTVQDVRKYYVVAQHNACTDNEYTSNQVAINQIISTNANISIDPEEAVTTPWEPVTITVKPDAGYIYELTYTDGNLAAVDGVRIKQNGDSYTYYIPRPDSWGTGDSDSDPVRDPINYVIKAQLKVDGEESECKLKDATATIQLKDEDNENCPK